MKVRFQIIAFSVLGGFLGGWWISSGGISTSSVEKRSNFEDSAMVQTDGESSSLFGSFKDEDWEETAARSSGTRSADPFSLEARFDRFADKKRGNAQSSGSAELAGQTERDSAKTISADTSNVFEAESLENASSKGEELAAVKPLEKAQTQGESPAENEISDSAEAVRESRTDTLPAHYAPTLYELAARKLISKEALAVKSECDFPDQIPADASEIAGESLEKYAVLPKDAETAGRRKSEAGTKDTAAQVAQSGTETRKAVPSAKTETKQVLAAKTAPKEEKVPAWAVKEKIQAPPQTQIAARQGRTNSTASVEKQGLKAAPMLETGMLEKVPTHGAVGQAAEIPPQNWQSGSSGVRTVSGTAPQRQMYTRDANQNQYASRNFADPNAAARNANRNMNVSVRSQEMQNSLEQNLRETPREQTQPRAEQQGQGEHVLASRNLPRSQRHLTAVNPESAGSVRLSGEETSSRENLARGESVRSRTQNAGLESAESKAAASEKTAPEGAAPEETEPERLYSLEMRNENLRKALGMYQVETGLKIVASLDVQGEVTFKGEHHDPEMLLRHLLADTPFKFVREGEFIYVAHSDRMVHLPKPLNKTVTRIFMPVHISLDELELVLSSNLSQFGSCQRTMDPNGKQGLLIEDWEIHHRTLEHIQKLVDTPAPENHLELFVFQHELNGPANSPLNLLTVAENLGLVLQQMALVKNEEEKERRPVFKKKKDGAAEDVQAYSISFRADTFMVGVKDQLKVEPADVFGMTTSSVELGKKMEFYFGLNIAEKQIPFHLTMTFVKNPKAGQEGESAILAEVTCRPKEALDSKSKPKDVHFQVPMPTDWGKALVFQLNLGEFEFKDEGVRKNPIYAFKGSRMEKEVVVVFNPFKRAVQNPQTHLSTAAVEAIIHQQEVMGRKFYASLDRKERECSSICFATAQRLRQGMQVQR